MGISLVVNLNPFEHDGELHQHHHREDDQGASFHMQMHAICLPLISMARFLGAIIIMMVIISMALKI